MSEHEHYRKLCQICRRTKAAHDRHVAGSCTLYTPTPAAPYPLRPQWHCARCKCTDEHTRYFNGWEIVVQGELGLESDPEIGEYYDDLTHEVELCDRCARAPDITTWLLGFALRAEVAAGRAGDEPAERSRGLGDDVLRELGFSAPSRLLANALAELRRTDPAVLFALHNELCEAATGAAGAVPPARAEALLLLARVAWSFADGEP